MRVIFLVALLATVCSGKRLITQDDLDVLFKKYITNNIASAEDKRNLEDVFELFQHQGEISRRSKDVLRFAQGTPTRQTLNCLVCRSAFAAMFQGVQANMSTESLVSSLTNLCASLGIESYDVCSGIIPLNLPIFVYIIKHQPLATPGAFCSLILQNVNSPNDCPMQDERFDWTVDIPPFEEPIEVPPATTATPLKVVVVTDFHIDPLYEAGGVAECDAPTCCRRGQRPRAGCQHRPLWESLDEGEFGNHAARRSGESNVIDLSEAETIRKLKANTQTRVCSRNNPAPAGYWGDYRNCDTPIWAFENVVDEIATTHNDIDAIYYIGDTIDHGVWETSYELINDMNTRVINKLKTTFGDIPIVPVIGNHETQPTNQFAPSYVTEPGLNTTWLYESLAVKWGNYLDEEALQTLRTQGDFSLLLRPGVRALSLNNNVAYRDNWCHSGERNNNRKNSQGNASFTAGPKLRVIVINTMTAYKYNWWLVFDPEDSKRHLDWLVAQLLRAERAGEKVHILAHIPPGVQDLLHSWTREYNRIVNRFANTIAAEFNGHTHSDEFKIFYSSTDNTPISVAWGGGSATSYTNYNLNYKVVSVDGATYAVNNIQSYVYNLTEANLTPHRNPHWFELYDMRHRFRLTDLSAASMDDLVYRMVTTDRPMLDLYSAFYSKLNDNRMSWCDDQCKVTDLCKTVVTVLWERQRCDELRTLFEQTNRLV